MNQMKQIHLWYVVGLNFKNKFECKSKHSQKRSNKLRYLPCPTWIFNPRSKQNTSTHSYLCDNWVFNDKL